MAYQMTANEKSVFAEAQFANAKGHTECVEFVRQTSRAPSTSTWKRGANVIDSAPGSIARGTVIATFDARGAYPSDGKGRHAAVYLSHTSLGIEVLDQWNAQGRVLRRTIYVKPVEHPRSNAAQTFYVVE